MRNFLFVLTSAAALTIMNVATAQTYLPPVPGGGVYSRGYTAPSYTAPGYTNPGYMWREQRANEDWRNNTWREQRYNEDWRNNNWRTPRANEDWRQREDYAKQATPNNAVDRKYLDGAAATENYPVDKDTDKECVFGSGGLARPCLDFAKDKAKVGRSTGSTVNRPMDTTGKPTDRKSIDGR